MSAKYTNKKLIILGAGESGVGAALLGRQQNYEVFVSDSGALSESLRDELEQQKIPFEQGQHSISLILAAGEVIKSPGISEETEIMKQVRAAGIPVISEIEFAYRFAGNAKIIAITGSNGKSTTTSLIFDIFKMAGRNAACVGNIGYSFARQVATNPVDYYIVEASSFQLDDIIDFRPDVAVLLNITPDHLDRYDHKMENYVRSKFRITMNQTSEDYFIYCKDDPEIMHYIKQHSLKPKTLSFTIMESINEGGFIENDMMNIQVGEEDIHMSIYELALKGKHNLYNSMAAGIAARTMEIRNVKIRESLTSFKTLEHRLEYITTVRGVDFINDSKATNVNSVWFALESINHPIVLIMGGVDKGNDYTQISDLVKEKVKAIVCLGTDNQPIHKAFGKDVEVIVNTSDMKDAVQGAFLLAHKGDTVLLSPACASFDLFKNYEDRGRQFKKLVREL